MDTSLGKLREVVKDRGAWRAALRGGAVSPPLLLLEVYRGLVLLL